MTATTANTTTVPRDTTGAVTLKSFRAPAPRSGIRNHPAITAPEMPVRMFVVRASLPSGVHIVRLSPHPIDPPSIANMTKSTNELGEGVIVDTPSRIVGASVGAAVVTLAYHATFRSFRNGRACFRRGPAGTSITMRTPLGELWFERTDAKAPSPALLLKLIFTSAPLSIQVNVLPGPLLTCPSRSFRLRPACGYGHARPWEPRPP